MQTEHQYTFQRLDHQRARARNDSDGGLPVLDGELDGDAEALPVAGRFRDVFTDLLGGLRVGSIAGRRVRRKEQGEVLDEER